MPETFSIESFLSDKAITSLCSARRGNSGACQPLAHDHRMTRVALAVADCVSLASSPVGEQG
jgi:hypothetical protein